MNQFHRATRIESARFLAGVVLAAVAQLAAAQDAVSEDSLRGTWMVGGSQSEESFTFTAGEFFYGYTQRKKDGMDIPPVSVRSEGAYKFARSACSAGAVQGNLWIVRHSDRCCFNAYMMSKTLVLDEVKGGLPRISFLCRSKTLRRETTAVGDIPNTLAEKP